MSQKIFCPSCGKEMASQHELCGQYRFHDEYFGCEACDQCWEVEDCYKKLKLCSLKLSEKLKYIRNKRAEEKRKRDAKPGIESLNSSEL